MLDVKRSDKVLAISDGRTGNARQAEALASTLMGGPYTTQVLKPRIPWCWTAPYCLLGARHAFGTEFLHILRRPPFLAIGCGRQAALATRLLHKQSTGVVQILDPRLPAHYWDLLVVPEHDRIRGHNVLTLLGSLHPVNDAWLAMGRAQFPKLGRLPGQRVALLVGAPTTQAPWQPAELEALCTTLLRRLPHRGTVLATTSQRTSPVLAAQLRTRLAAIPGLFWNDTDEGPNPYPGILGWADAIIATADSVNLLSEACATRVPVTAAFSDQARGRIRRFIDALGTRLCTVDNLLDIDTLVQPLRETERIANEVRIRLGVEI
ncbi:MAG TPA: mitochondrial fission ELM1 family protein [Xylella taiwanensis]